MDCKHNGSAPQEYNIHFTRLIWSVIRASYTNLSPLQCAATTLYTIDKLLEAKKMWVSANDIPCDCGPCYSNSGVKEYHDEKYSNPRRSNSGGAGVRKILPEEKLRELYVVDGLSDDKIADKSEVYFGFKCSHIHVWRERKRLGIESRKKGHQPFADAYTI